ncbi:FAD:protein FMN transferase [Xanthomonas sp. XNM01]|uniref:FAD:protein FMN transferase n=1 Tax=Xanthomonas sp. XNM01 TaxID=2769289 RepID=UPI00177AEC58|nr:FAD:protein FMN transferase [Xanthomonas sp. XNM01]MBD9367829.1 FAD:protein FMN transferase [Xanthomonas sp. XNM01]
MHAFTDSTLALAALGGQTMGTRWSVRLAVSRTADLHAFHDGIQRQLDTVVAQMSTWEADSDISRFRDAPADSWHPLPGGFSRVLTAALEVAQASDGAFDPTVGPLVELWGFGAGAQPRRIPDQARLAAARARCGWHQLRRRDGDGALHQPGGLQLDFSGIAKGFGVDLVSEYLQGIGVCAALVEVGGELRAHGRKPDGDAWRVLVETPPDVATGATPPPRVLSLDGLAVATSGDRWHHFEQNGRRYSHSIDPRSGQPVPHAAASVTVLATDAMRADAWATAMTVLGPEAGLRHACAAGLAVRFVSSDGAEVSEAMSPAFEEHLVG